MKRDGLRPNTRAIHGGSDEPRVNRPVAAPIHLSATFESKDVDEQVELDEPQVVAVIEKMVKQRRDSISQYRSGGRADLAEKEQSEIDLLAEYLPQAMSAGELEALVEKVLEQTGASTMKDMGKVMGLIKAEAQGRADMAQVSTMIKARLSG